MQVKSDHYDVVIIGAGMSGLAAGIRLAMYDKRVIILERHNAPGGLNSFYSIAGRRYDVGLHAMTNYVPAGVKGTPLGKILRQLRLSREALQLRPQIASRITIPGCSLMFTNDFACLEQSIAESFPGDIDGFRQLAGHIRAYDETALDNPEISAREVVARYIQNPVLVDMLFLPLMYYGSATEHDMDFSQFAIMFKALFFEGFARPPEGVRTIIRTLTSRYRELGGERKMKLGVRRITAAPGRAHVLELDDGSTITAERVLSSIGAAETEKLCGAEPSPSAIGRLSFVETITVLDEQPAKLGWPDTIVFFNDNERFDYACPDDLVDPRSGVICFPNNYAYEPGEGPSEGIFRLTALANYAGWKALAEPEYRAEKEAWFGRLRESALRFIPEYQGQGKSLEERTLATDMFTPLTVKRFTGHLGGAIYGAPRKHKHGTTPWHHIYLCGTDQGFLGITGAMLSGISMANLHGLSGQ